MKRSLDQASASLIESVSIPAEPQNTLSPLGGELDSSLATASVANYHHASKQSIIEQFRCVDTILVSLRSKRISPQFSEYEFKYSVANVIRILLIII